MQTSLLPELMTRIAKASAKHDVAELERLTRLARRAQELEGTLKSSAAELSRISQAINKPGLEIQVDFPRTPAERSARSSIRVSIDWRSAGYKRDPVTIEERKGSRALVAFLAEIRTALGESALEKLTALKISRGPLVSRDPSKDFINRGNHTVYANHQIPQSGYFVITHSGTTEKIEAIHSAARLLNLGDFVKAQLV